MTLSMFQAPAVGLRESETEGETATATLSATAAEVTSPAVDVKRLGEQIRFWSLGGSARYAALCAQCAHPWRTEDSVFL